VKEATTVRKVKGILFRFIYFFKGFQKNGDKEDFKLHRYYSYHLVVEVGSSKKLLELLSNELPVLQVHVRRCFFFVFFGPLIWSPLLSYATDCKYGLQKKKGVGQEFCILFVVFLRRRWSLLLFLLVDCVQDSSAFFSSTSSSSSYYRDEFLSVPIHVVGGWVVGFVSVAQSITIFWALTSQLRSSNTYRKVLLGLTSFWTVAHRIASRQQHPKTIKFNLLLVQLKFTNIFLTNPFIFLLLCAQAETNRKKKSALTVVRHALAFFPSSAVSLSFSMTTSSTSSIVYGHAWVSPPLSPPFFCVEKHQEKWMRVVA